MGSAAGTLKSRPQASIDAAACDIKPKIGATIKDGQSLASCKQPLEIQTPEYNAHVADALADLDLIEANTAKDGTSCEHRLEAPTSNRAADVATTAAVLAFLDAADDIGEGGELPDETRPLPTPRNTYRREDFLTCEFSEDCYRLLKHPEHGRPGPWVRWRQGSSNDRSNLGTVSSSDDARNSVAEHSEWRSQGF